MGSLTEPVPVSMATDPQPRLLTSCHSCLSGREGGTQRVGPPTPEPGGGGPVASLPAGPLPGQLVTFPGWRRPGSLVASPGPGLAGSGVPSHSGGPGLTEPCPPHLPFHPGWTQPGSLHAPLTPTHIRPLSLAACPTELRRGRVGGSGS